MRLIDADAFNERLIRLGALSIKSALDEEPTIDPSSLVKRGRWLPYEADKDFHYCSECKAQAFNYEDGRDVIEVLSNYCYSCGAPMED